MQAENMKNKGWGYIDALLRQWKIEWQAYIQQRRHRRATETTEVREARL